MGKQGLVAVIGFSVVIAFILLGLLYNLLSTGMAPEETYRYSDFEPIGSLEEVDALNDDYFMVFYYDPNGEKSDRVKHDVFHFTVDYQDTFPIYYLESPDTDASELLEPPGMLIYENGALIDLRSGESGIYSLLDDAGSGLIP
ncbi:MAG: hypothetical protein ACOCU0_03605 [Bacillota bacterium]